MLIEPKLFVSSTLMSRQQARKVGQVLQMLIDCPESYDFRQPVEYQRLGLADYLKIVKQPMDLGTVKKKLERFQYKAVEDCLYDIMRIWNNCKSYNAQDHWVYKMAIKMEKMSWKLIKNYLPFVRMENMKGKRKQPKDPSYSTLAKNIMKLYDNQCRHQQQKQQVKLDESNFAKSCKQFLALISKCSCEQVGVIFMLIKRHSSHSIIYDQQGNINVDLENIEQDLLRRLMQQFEVWGVK